MEKTHEIAYELKNMLMNSNEYKKLKESEEIVFNNSTSKKLISNYHYFLEKYQNEKTEEILRLLHQSKFEMDSDPLVKQYKESFKEYEILVGKITDIVFEDFSSLSFLEK